jgi:hypothetical protein
VTKIDAKASAPAGAVKREVVITRVFDAPRGLVFKAWTDPEHMARWWGPKGFTNPICELDARVGGAWRIVMMRTLSRRACDGAPRSRFLYFIRLTSFSLLLHRIYWQAMATQDDGRTGFSDKAFFGIVYRNDITFDCHNIHIYRVIFVCF